MRRALPLLLVLLAGCPAPTQYAIRRPDLDCARATRVAYRTLTTMGYTVTGVVEPSVKRPGSLRGVKTNPDGTTAEGNVRINCDPGGVTLQPVEGGVAPSFEFSRGFGYSFKSLVQRPDVETPQAETGLQLLLERIGSQKAGLDLGGAAISGDQTLIRVTVRNGTDREVAVTGARITLLTADGTEGHPLAGAARDGAIAAGGGGPQVRGALLDGRVVVPGGRTEVRYLVYPPGAWRDAQVAVEDVETGETDGFYVRVE
ncbi:MAG: hypothetical protein KIT14_02775 [bacterium]|nr:hypothetical protein [bacterium]